VRSRYRQIIMDCIKEEGSFFPFIGLALSDIVMIEEGNKYVTEVKNWEGYSINFWKMTLLSNVFRQIFESQQRPYKYTLIGNYAQYLDDLQPITDLKGLMDLSKSIESPEYISKFKETEEEKKRKENTEQTTIPIISPMDPFQTI